MALNSTVVVTSELRHQLDDDELDAVLAHELAHVRNRDATVMSVAYLLPTFTYVVSTLTYYALYCEDPEGIKVEVVGPA